jgi:hypothetical protein
MVSWGAFKLQEMLKKVLKGIYVPAHTHLSRFWAKDGGGLISFDKIKIGSATLLCRLGEQRPPRLRGVDTVASF